MPAEAGNVRVAHQIFAVLVMRARVHRQAHVVQQRAEFQRHALARRQLVHRRELIEELRGQTPHLLAMRGVGVHARGEAARLLAQRFGAFVVRGGRSEMRGRQIVQDAFAHAHARHHQSVGRPAIRRAW